jgi:DNA-binding transcriptional MerR regulator
MTEERISITKFAVEVGLSRRTIHRYITSGALKPSRTLGGKPYFTVIDVDRFLANE